MEARFLHQLFFFYLTIQTFFHIIAWNKLTIASYKIRLTIYKVRIAR